MRTWVAALLALGACSREAPQRAGVTVLSFEPQGQVDATRALEVKFSQPISPTEGREILSIVPALPGDYRWLSQDTLQFVPRGAFAPCTRYRVKVLAADEPEFAFHTRMFGLASVESFYESAQAGTIARVNVELTHPVTPEAARSAISFSDQRGKQIGASLDTRAASQVMAFSLEPTAVDAEVSIRIDGSLAAQGGGEPLGKSVVKGLHTGENAPLAVESITPTQYGSDLAVQVRFTSEVDAVAFERAFTVAPAVPMHFVENYHGVTAYGAFQPRTKYSVTLKRGLTARTGRPLVDEVAQQIEMPDLEPVVRFPERGLVLLQSGARQIAVETVNVKRVAVEVTKVFENNLVHVVSRLESGSVAESMGKRVLDSTLEIDGPPNQTVRTTIAFDDFAAQSTRRGLYFVEVRDAERGWAGDHKWALSTDLGITAKVGGNQTRVQVLSLSTLEPVAGAEIELLSRTNASLAKLTTDAKGNALGRVSGEDPVGLVIAKRGSDVSYLPIQSVTALATSDFEVGGEAETSAAYEAFVYSDRGAYRPGDSVRLTALVRDRALMTPPPFPFLVELRDPSWRAARLLKGTAAVDGAQSFEIAIPRDAPTGRWTARILGAGEDLLGETSFSVEDFIPDRIAVEVEALGSGSSNKDAPIPFRVRARQLFGPPAAGLDVELACRFVEQRFSAQSYDSFSFAARSDRDPESLVESVVLGRFTLDGEGKIERPCVLATDRKLIGPVRVSLSATVFEKGGRSVTSAGAVTLHPLPHYIGVHRNSESYHVEEGSDAALEVIVVDPDGRPITGGVQLSATFFEEEWRTNLKLVDGRYRYVSSHHETQLVTRSITSGPNPVPLPYVAPHVGRYRVEVSTREGAKSSFSFWVSGEGSAGWAATSPDRLAMSPDRARYSVGQTAQVMVRAPFPGGKLLLSVERDRVIWQGTAEVEGDTATIQIPIQEGMSPNAYVVAQLVRRPGAAESDAPMRAFGVVPLVVESQRHELLVDIDAPAEVRPQDKLQIKVRGLGAERAPHFTVAAVDEGLLLLDGFEAPDPFSFFTRRRRLGLTTHDLYGLLMPEVEPRPGKKVDASGGDAAFRGRHLDPFGARRVKPVALWSGVVAAGPDGEAVVTMSVPEFSGTLRLMVVGFAGDRFGSATARVRVADPVVVQPTLPRFVGTLDRFRMPVQLFNTTRAPVQVEVTATAEGGIALSGNAAATIGVEAGGSALATFDLTAGEVPGDAKITVQARSSAGETSVVTELPIRPPSSTVVQAEFQIARPYKKASFHLPGGFIPSSIEARLEIGTNPAFRYSESLGWLLQYPHGCVEQTTSRAFPLLYLPDLARAVGRDLAPGQSVRDHFISSGIGRVLGMMLPSGALAYWPGQSWGHPWTTVYGAHFLVEAKRAGYSVDGDALDRLLQHLALIGAGTVPGGYREAIDFRTRAYALYVLALAGRPNASGLHYLADRFERSLVEEDAEVPADNEVRVLIAGGLAHAGLWDRANKLFGEQLPATTQGTRSGFFSSARADALALSILADVKPEHPSIPTLLDVLGNRATGGRWATTQENAYALMAMGKINRKLEPPKYFIGTVSIDGEDVRRFESTYPTTMKTSGAEWAGKRIEVSVSTNGKAYVSMRVSGIKADTLPQPASEGLAVERHYYRADGKPITDSAIERGALVITELTVRAPEGVPVPNVAIIDLLPAGLEIENPRLVEDTHGLEWLKGATPADHADVRDDRIVFYTDVASGETRRFFYASRAVTEGQYTLPHLQAEAMYDPTIRAIGGGGTFTVRAR